MRHHLLVPAFAGLICPLAAQTTYIVDAANGAGANFTTLKAALAVAVHGDSIVVRVGWYVGGATSQGVRIEGTPSVTMVETLRVAGLPAGRVFSLADVTLHGPTANTQLGMPYLELDSNQGLVHLENVTVVRGYTRLVRCYHGGGVSAVDCAGVTLTDCWIRGGWPGVFAQRSSLTVSGSAIEGSDTWDPCAAAQYVPGAPALVADQASVHLSNTSLLGGDGQYSYPYAPFTPSFPALRATDSRVGLFGSRGTLVAAGTADPQFAIPAVELTRSAFARGWGLQLRQSNGTLQVTAAVANVTVTLGPAAVGGQVRADLQAASINIAAVLLLGVAGVPTPFQTVDVLLRGPVVAIPGTLSIAGQLTASVGIPNQPSLRGALLAAHGVELTRLGPNVSAGAVRVVR